MQNVSELFKESCRQNTHNCCIKINVATNYESIHPTDTTIKPSIWGVIRDEDIVQDTLTIDSLAIDGSCFNIGCACSAKLSFTMTRDGYKKFKRGQLVKGSFLEIIQWNKVADENQSDTDYSFNKDGTENETGKCRLGGFYVSELTTNDYATEIVAYDGMYTVDRKLMDQQLDPLLETKAKITGWLKAIEDTFQSEKYHFKFDETIVGKLVNTNTDFGLDTEVDIDNAREILRQLSYLVGGVAIFNSSCDVQLKTWGSSSVETIYDKQIFSGTFGDKTQQIQGFATSVAGFKYSKELKNTQPSLLDESCHGVTLAKAENKFIRNKQDYNGTEISSSSVEVLDQIASVVLGVKFLEADFECAPYPHLEIGDCISTVRNVVSSNGDISEVRADNIFIGSMTYNYGKSMSIKSFGNDRSNSIGDDDYTSDPKDKGDARVDTIINGVSGYQTERYTETIPLQVTALNAYGGQVWQNISDTFTIKDLPAYVDNTLALGIRTLISFENMLKAASINKANVKNVKWQIDFTPVRREFDAQYKVRNTIGNFRLEHNTELVGINGGRTSYDEGDRNGVNTLYMTFTPNESTLGALDSVCNYSASSSVLQNDKDAHSTWHTTYSVSAQFALDLQPVTGVSLEYGNASDFTAGKGTKTLTDEDVVTVLSGEYESTSSEEYLHFAGSQMYFKFSGTISKTELTTKCHGAGDDDSFSEKYEFDEDISMNLANLGSKLPLTVSTFAHDRFPMDVTTETDRSKIGDADSVMSMKYKNLPLVMTVSFDVITKVTDKTGADKVVDVINNTSNQSASNSTAISETNKKVVELTTSIASIATRTGNLENSVSSLQTSMQEVNTSITDLQQRVSTTEAQMVSAQKNIGKNSNDIAVLGNRVTVLEECCSSVKETLTSIQASIKVLETGYASLDERVKKLEGDTPQPAPGAVTLSIEVSDDNVTFTSLESKYYLSGVSTWAVPDGKYARLSVSSENTITKAQFYTVNDAGTKTPFGDETTNTYSANISLYSVTSKFGAKAEVLGQWVDADNISAATFTPLTLTLDTVKSDTGSWGITANKANGVSDLDSSIEVTYKFVAATGTTKDTETDVIQDYSTTNTCSVAKGDSAIGNVDSIYVHVYCNDGVSVVMTSTEELSFVVAPTSYSLWFNVQMFKLDGTLDSSFTTCKAANGDFIKDGVTRIPITDGDAHVNVNPQVAPTVQFFESDYWDESQFNSLGKKSNRQWAVITTEHYGNPYKYKAEITNADGSVITTDEFVAKRYPTLEANGGSETSGKTVTVSAYASSGLPEIDDTVTYKYKYLYSTESSYVTGEENDKSKFISGEDWVSKDSIKFQIGSAAVGGLTSGYIHVYVTDGIETKVRCDISFP